VSQLELRLLEYRALRDAAKANFLADVDHAKHSFSGKNIAGRFVDRISVGARDVFDQASETAEDNRGIIAALIGAIILWLSRDPLLELLGLAPEDGDEEDPGASPHHDGTPTSNSSGEYDDRPN
jgi:hypothetical protein